MGELMTQDFGKTILGETPGRRSISVSAAIVVVVLVGVVGFEAYTLHGVPRAADMTHLVGAHIYSELQTLETDVLSGKIRSPLDPRFIAVENEITTFQMTRQNQSFNDTNLFIGLQEYFTSLLTIAKFNAETPSSVDRGRDLLPLKQQKAEIENDLDKVGAE